MCKAQQYNNNCYGNEEKSKKNIDKVTCYLL